MSSWTPSLPVLIPAVIVTVGWLIALKKQAALRWRMALFTASLAVYFLGIALGLARYHMFGLEVHIARDFEAMHQLYPDLVGAVSMLKVSTLALVVHLLLAALSCQIPEPRRISS